MINFRNTTHKEFFDLCLERACNNDCYHQALFYTLGLTDDCIKNIDSIFDFNTNCVKPDFHGGWVTGTDIRIIRLAFNLFNNGCPTAFKIENPEEKADEIMNYIPTEIFGYLSNELKEYAFEAIRIRYEMK